LSRYYQIPLLFIAMIFFTSCMEESPTRNFITRDGNLLKEGDSTFRFLSFNIPNINFVEDEMEFAKLHPFRLPTTFEIRDAFESVKEMGGTVVRAYTFPVKRETDTLGIPRYVLGPGKFDENSFKVMDTVLAIANDVDIRLIIPLLNNWKWMGGVPQYAGFRNKESKEFWTDALLISDFKKTINFVLNRVNTVTGIPYKDDKSILCWETGNELWSPYSWVNEIASYIKSIDNNHLVMDGYNAIDGLDIHEGSLQDTLIDIVSTHHYKLHPHSIISDIQKQLDRIGGRKPYVIGEFGFLGTTAIQQISEFIIKNEISGGLIWSLRHHREEGGYFWHSEPHGGDIYKAFHYPGFSSGLEYNEEKFLTMFREKAFEIRNLPVPEITKPKAPVLLPIVKPSAISWKGSVGAKYYDIQRVEIGENNWKTIAYNVSDADKYYRPLFNDYNAEIGKVYSYRVIAKNIAGSSEPSNIIGPVKCSTRTLVDELENLTVLYYSEGDYKYRSNNERIFKEDPHRLELDEGAGIYYYIPGKIELVKVFTFAKDNEESLSFKISNDGLSYKNIEHCKSSYFLGKGDYYYWLPNEYNISIIDSSVTYSYIKIEVKDVNQISRVELEYLPF